MTSRGAEVIPRCLQSGSALCRANSTAYKLEIAPPGKRNENSLLSMAALTRNSSGDEIANVNFLYDDIVHILQNTINSCINSATDRRGYVLERMFYRIQ